MSMGQCINVSSVCDGTMDCLDGSDESEMVCPSKIFSFLSPDIKKYIKIRIKLFVYPYYNMRLCQ